MADIVDRSSQLHIEDFEVLDVLDVVRNEVFKVHRLAAARDAVVLRLLKPEFEPILPGRRHAGSRRLLRVVNRSHGWVPLLAVGTTTAGLDYIVQPFIPGGSLLDVLGTGVPWRSALSMVGDAAAVVGQLGAQGLALGCLRPSYVFPGDDTVLVSCFGTSTRRFDDGTTEYTAPELQRDSECTPACDVYSLGLMLAELLADRQREPGEPVRNLMSSLPCSIPAEVIELLDHTTMIGMANRIATTALLNRAIVRLLADIPDITAGSSDPPVVETGSGPDRPTPLSRMSPSSAVDGPTDPGPLHDLLQLGGADQVDHEDRGTAVVRSAAELELEAMLETLVRNRPDRGADGVTGHRDDLDALRNPYER